MRSVTTDLRIQQRLHEYRLDWEALRIRCANNGADEQCALEMVNRLREFVTAIRMAIRDETNDWVRDFTESLGALEKYLTSAAD